MSFFDILLRLVAKDLCPPHTHTPLLYCINIPVSQISPTATVRPFGFCKVQKTRVIMLLGGRQVGPMGPFLWQECHKRRKLKAENEKRKHMAEERSSWSTPLNTLAVLSHKELGLKGFDTSFHNPVQEMEVTVWMETSAAAWWKEQTISVWILWSSVKSPPRCLGAFQRKRYPRVSVRGADFAIQHEV